MSSPPHDHLTILPVPDEVRRERDRETRVSEQPRAVQEWFDATAEDRAMDARLRAFAAALLPGSANDPLDATGDDEDETLATLDDLEVPAEGGEREEGREAASARRLARQPVVLQEWFDAATEGGEQDARLRAFAADLLVRQARGDDASAAPAETGEVVTFTPATRQPSGRTPWTRWGAAVLALAAAGLLVVRGLPADGPGAASDDERAVVGQVARDAGASATGAGTDVDPAVDPVELDGLLAPPDQAPTFAEAAWPAVSSPSRDLGVPTPDGARAGASTPRAPSSPIATPGALAVATSPTPALPSPSLAVVTAVTPSSPPLLSSGEIEADTSPWRGEVVDGLDLRADRGFGVLSGTQAAPVLALSNDATVRVDVDRAAVDPAFATFTIRTVSATVRVVGTKYSVTTVGSRTEVATRRGTVQVECADGRRKLVSEGQSATCEPQPDPRLLVHMQALDRPPQLGQPALTSGEQYAHLQRQRQASTPSAFVATADVMLSRALASEDLRQALEAVRVDAMCDLGWEGPAKRAARAWVEGGGQVERERIERIAEEGCEAR